MADDGVVVLYDNNIVTPNPNPNSNSFSIKMGLAQILRGGAIIEITNTHQAKIAESAGACCVAVAGAGTGVVRMADPALIKEIKGSMSIPIIANGRVGHFVEAQILETLGVDYIDESEALSIADEENFINKHNFRIPFVCGCRDLGGALRRIREGAAMIRTQGNVGRTGSISETIGNVRKVMGQTRMLNNMDNDEVFAFAKRIEAPYDLVAQTKQLGRLPVVHFAAGGIVTPADAAIMMQLGCDGVFIGQEIFECSDPYKKIRAIVEAVRNYNDPHVLANVSSGLSEMMGELNVNENRMVEN